MKTPMWTLSPNSGEGKGGKLGGVEGGETVVAVYCMREEFISNNK